MNFIDDVFRLIENEKYIDWLFEGLRTTLVVSVFAALLGLVIGTIVAMVGISKNNWIMTIPKLICKLYVTIIRGTPMALLL